MGDCPLIVIDIITATHLSTLVKESSSSSTASSYFCVAKFNGREIGRTECSLDSFEPTWSNRISSPLDSTFDSRQLEYNRPFFFEFIEIALFDVAKSTTERVGECRVPLVDVGKSKYYKLVKPSGGGVNLDIESSARLQISLDIDGELNSFFYSNNPRQMFLSELLPPTHPDYSHLYMDFGTSWSPSKLLGSLMMPGPLAGEVVEDMHATVEWKVVAGSNCFGDKYHMACRGVLVITDIRVIFVPQELFCPLWVDSESINRATDRPLSPDQELAFRRMTYQVPVSAVQDCRVQSVDANSAILLIESRDGFIADFLVKRPAQTHGRPGSTARARTGARRPSAKPFFLRSKTATPTVALNYFSGLETHCVAPFLWCSRAADCIMYMVREDRVWIKWATYLKLTCDVHSGVKSSSVSRGNASSAQALWNKKALQHINEEMEFRRLRVVDGEWNISDINCGYEICATYPQTLVLPRCLADDEVRAAALERSKGRICALSWIHPSSKVPLCRASQPNSGMSGSLEADKRACLAIKNCCPTGLPLRIADARPKLNANANALQGKGFENIAFFGGPSVASITFLDVDNIHVMRNSLIKLREGWFANSALTHGLDSEYVQSSRWPFHISTLLRGAVGIAESILFGYPVLVHCSDGWDRTAQLSALPQVMMDPHYRTIDGFFTLINKEFCAFGHKFEHRTNRHVHFKESSPTFLQFLDAVYQLLVQFPTSFEYSSGFLVIFAQAAYSGLFTNFRGDCEDERNSLMRRTAPLEDMPLSDLNYSSIFFYVNMLLRCDMFSGLLVNPHYQKPAAAHSTLQYLRPRTGVIDIVVWKEGLSGFNKNHFEVSLSHQSASFTECIISESSVVSRFAGYLDLHKTELDETVRDRLDVIASEGSSIRKNAPYFYSKPGLGARVQFRQSSVEGHVDCVFNGPPEEVDEEDWVDENLQYEAASRLQLWYRSIRCGWSAAVEFLPADTPEKTKNHIFRTLRVLAFTELMASLTLRKSVSRLLKQQIRSVVDEVVEEALVRCMRCEVAVRFAMPDSLAGGGIDDYRARKVGVDSSAYQSPSTMTGRLQSMAAMAAMAATSVAEGMTSNSSGSSSAGAVGGSIATSGSRDFSPSPSTDSPTMKKSFSSRMMKIVSKGVGLGPSTSSSSARSAGNYGDEASV